MKLPNRATASSQRNQYSQVKHHLFHFWFELLNRWCWDERRQPPEEVLGGFARGCHHRWCRLPVFRLTNR
jgi:hypothetical protein